MKRAHILAMGIMCSLACHTPTRGEPCKHDDDCKKGGLECAEIAIGGNAFCTTHCKMDAGDCPEGWKCHDIGHFSDLQDNVCVRK